MKYLSTSFHLQKWEIEKIKKTSRPNHWEETYAPVFAGISKIRTAGNCIGMVLALILGPVLVCAVKIFYCLDALDRLAAHISRWIVLRKKNQLHLLQPSQLALVPRALHP